MSGAIWKDNDRRAEFFARLEELIGEYPELLGPQDPDDIVDEVVDGYDPKSPKIRTGIVLVLAYGNLDYWDELVPTSPLAQSHYMTIGMLHQALHLTEQS